jgi:hypothetical protein
MLDVALKPLGFRRAEIVGLLFIFCRYAFVLFGLQGHVHAWVYMSDFLLMKITPLSPLGLHFIHTGIALGQLRKKSPLHKKLRHDQALMDNSELLRVQDFAM